MTDAVVSWLTSPVLRGLRDYWRDLRGARAMPSRADIDPAHIPSLLPYVFLVDVAGTPPVFRYRLIGTEITKMAGRDATGCLLDEGLYGDNTDRMLLTYRACVADRSPKAVRETVQFVDKDWITVEVLLVPLSPDGGDITMIFGGVDIVDEDARFDRPREELDWQT